MARTEKATALQTQISPVEVSQRIYTLRGRQVMLDQDLAEIYEVELRALKQTVTRNIERFPEDFMWRTTEDEHEILRSQLVIERIENLSDGCARPNIGSQSVIEKPESRSIGRRGSRYAPFAFTEHGVAMLSSVLNSHRAIQVNIGILRTFIQLRNEQKSRLDVVPKLESLENLFKQRFDRLETQLKNQPARVASLPWLAEKIHQVGVIQNAVAQHFGLSSDDLKSTSRTQAISLPRQIAIYLARKSLGMSFSEVGRHFGGRDHTTILHAYRKILADAEANTMIRTALVTLRNQIQPLLA